MTLLQIAFATVCAQDSTKNQLSNISPKYLHQVSAKMDTYYKSITSKTEKTLEKLAKWENKIKALLEKTSPETVQRLFGNGQLTFSAVLVQYKEGKQITDGYRTRYDEYRDKLTTTIKYLDDKKETLDSNLQKPLNKAKENADKLNEQLAGTEAIERFIKERKKQLMQQAIQYVGKNKYLQKINKESYYYVETLKNYKEIFSDPKKAEETAVKLLQKIPAFSEFIKRNSVLASLFRIPQDGSGNSANLSGLQTRNQINNLIQQQIQAGGPNAQQQFQQNFQAAQSQLNQLKEKILKAGGNTSDAELPDFKTNNQRTKTFWQKWELGVNVQTNRPSGILPVSSDLGLSAGFRPYNNFVTGVGIAGRIGWGKDIQHIAISYQGVSGRFFSELKLKGSFHAVAGFEMNYRSEIKSIEQLKDYSAWQRSGLIGVSKIISTKARFFKKTSAQLVWDYLSYYQVPKTQPILFRIGFSLK